jgi:hypothetical protein
MAPKKEPNSLFSVPTDWSNDFHKLRAFDAGYCLGPCSRRDQNHLHWETFGFSGVIMYAAHYKNVTFE